VSEFFNIGSWLGKKMEYHRMSTYASVKRKDVVQGEVWRCDLGFNIGEEKNKTRPVVVISNNRVNKTGKVIVAPITDAIRKVDVTTGVPQHNTWYLLFSDTTDKNRMYHSKRSLPRSAVTYPFLSKDSVVQTEELRSLSKARLLSKQGSLDPADLKRLKLKIKKVFDI
jgi:mRNA-degrading endonuclease toxin of MazEF toxin-antitoxin module